MTFWLVVQRFAKKCSHDSTATSVLPRTLKGPRRSWGRFLKRAKIGDKRPWGADLPDKGFFVVQELQVALSSCILPFSCLLHIKKWHAKASWGIQYNAHPGSSGLDERLGPFVAFAVGGPSWSSDFSQFLLRKALCKASSTHSTVLERSKLLLGRLVVIPASEGGGYGGT